MVSLCNKAGHAVDGYVYGRLINEVSIVSSREYGCKGYCRFSGFIESANGYLQR